MKILYVINQISNWSGDSRLLWLTVEFMKKRGHQVAIATTDGNPFRDLESSKKYSKTVEKLSNFNGNFVLINDVPVFPVHSMSSHFGMYSFNAGIMAKKIIRIMPNVMAKQNASHTYVYVKNKKLINNLFKKTTLTLVFDSKIFI